MTAMATPWAPAALVPGVLAVTGLLLTRWGVSRATQDAWCVKLAVGSYLLKILLTLALYAVTFHGGLSFTESFEGGFWAFAEDASAHHNKGHELVRYWEDAGPFPEFSQDNWFFLVYVALLYRFLGVQPLNVSVLNAWYGTLLLLAGFIILQRLGATASARRWGVGLLGFWPSLLLWSSQPLKDPLLLTLTMAVFCGLVLLVTEPQGRGIRSAGWRLALLGVSLSLLALLRLYTAWFFGLTALLVCGGLLIRGWRARLPLPRGNLLAVALLVPLVLTAAGRVHLRKLMTPPLPWRAQTPPVLPLHEVREGPAKPPPATLTARAIEVLDEVRRGFISTGGRALLDQEVRFQRPTHVLAYLPRGISVALFAPFPWQWVETGGRTRHLRAFAAAEMLLIYLFVGGLLLRLHQFSQYPGFLTGALGFFILVTMLLMGLTVANVGTLFRLRLQFLLPLLLLGCLVGVPDAYRRGLGRLWQWARA